MVKKLSRLSPNLVIILSQLMTNQNLMKLVYYNDDVPLSQPDIANGKSLFKKYFFPSPFDENIQTDDTSSVRAFFLKVDLTKEYPTGENTEVLFDIIVAKNNWLINDADGNSLVRPYEIASEIVDMLDDVSISTVGKLHFIGLSHMSINHQFDGLRLLAEMHTLH